MFLFGSALLSPPYISCSPRTEHQPCQHHHPQIDHQKHLKYQNIATCASEERKLVEVDNEVETDSHPYSVDREHEEDDYEAYEAANLGPSGQATAEPHVGYAAHTTAEYGERHYQTSVLKEGRRGEYFFFYTTVISTRFKGVYVHAVRVAIDILLRNGIGNNSFNCISLRDAVKLSVLGRIIRIISEDEQSHACVCTDLDIILWYTQTSAERLYKTIDIILPMTRRNLRKRISWVPL